MDKHIESIESSYITVTWDNGEKEDIMIPDNIWYMISRYLDEIELERNQYGE
tara:strand:+ start:264 stop:419 length:156 start_codon:yes stop_codon:yes gene_type:complete